MAHKPVVFIGRDYSLNAVFDKIADALQQQGCRTIRGWPHKPPQLTDYPPDSWPELFAPADVIVISTADALSARTARSRAAAARCSCFPTIGTDSIELADARDLGLVVGNGATPENFSGHGGSKRLC